jgi:hypothetical protein
LFQNRIYCCIDHASSSVVSDCCRFAKCVSCESPFKLCYALPN